MGIKMTDNIYTYSHIKDVLSSRVQNESSTHTIGDINQILDQLAQASGEKGKVKVVQDRILGHFSGK